MKCDNELIALFAALAAIALVIHLLVMKLLPKTFGNILTLINPCQTCAVNRIDLAATYSLFEKLQQKLDEVQQSGNEKLEQVRKSGKVELEQVRIFGQQNFENIQMELEQVVRKSGKDELEQVRTSGQQKFENIQMQLKQIRISGQQKFEKFKWNSSRFENLERRSSNRFEYLGNRNSRR